MNRLFIIWISICLATSVLSQSQTNTKKGLGMNGSIRLFQNFYSTDSESPRTSPWSYGLSGTIGLSIGKYRVPINLVYQDHGFSLTKPLFFLGTSVNLGSLNLHLGHRNTTFSKYTLGGATFFGAAAEYQSKWLRLGLMTGSFQNPFAQRDSIVYGTVELPGFERRGISAKLGFGSPSNFVDLIVLKVKDDATLPEDGEFFNNNVLPKDNLVLGTVINQRILRNLFLKVDAAVSGITYDLNYDSFEIDDETVEQYNNLLDVNLSSNVSYAGDIELRANIKTFRTIIQYRRIGPHFLSLGTNFLNTDREDYLFKIIGSLLDRKLTFASSVGIQKTNLDDQKSRNTTRLINSLNLKYRASKQFNVNLLYYNYDIESKPSIIEDNDSLKLVRIMNQFRVSPKYSFETEGFSHQISLITSYRNVNSLQRNNERNSRNYMISGAYRLKIVDRELSFRLGLNTRRNNNGAGIIRDRHGIVLTGTKALLKNQLQASVNISYFKNLINSKNDGQSLRTAINAKYHINKVHHFNLMLNYLHRSSIVFDSRNDIQLRTSYAYNF